MITTKSEASALYDTASQVIGFLNHMGLKAYSITSVGVIHDELWLDSPQSRRSIQVVDLFRNQVASKGVHQTAENCNYQLNVDNPYRRWFYKCDNDPHQLFRESTF